MADCLGTGNSDLSVVLGGHTTRATSSSMPPPTQFPNVYFHSLFYGDCSGVTTAGEMAIPFWTDTRDVGITSCPGDPRNVCALGNDQDVFVTAIGRDKGGDQGGDNH